MNSIGERIKLLRNALNMRQKDFAERILVSAAYLSKIESGKEKAAEKLLKLITLEFDVPHDWLINGIGEMYKINDDELLLTDTDMSEAVSSGCTTLLTTLNNQIKDSSEYEKKMLFDILVELTHLLKMQPQTQLYKTQAIKSIRDVFCNTSFYIERCYNLKFNDDLECQRIESLKENNIEAYTDIINEMLSIFMKGNVKAKD